MFVEFDWMRALATSPILMVLCGCSVITLGIALERWFYFRRRQDDPDATLLEALDHLRRGRLREAVSTCKRTVHPVGAVGVEVLEHAAQAPADIEERLQVALSQQKLLLERNVGMLGTMAAIAPLIGLLGTVWGIMRAFHDMANTGSAAPAVVAAGVSEALMTTAAGLVIAVPAVLLFNYFSRRMNVMLTVAENHARSLRAAVRGESLRGVGTTPTEVDQTQPAPAVAPTLESKPEPVGSSGGRG
jgi:biopolymer transport protein ExbB